MPHRTHGCARWDWSMAILCMEIITLVMNDFSFCRGHFILFIFIDKLGLSCAKLKLS